jgi:hypothetical protein
LDAEVSRVNTNIDYMYVVDAIIGSGQPLSNMDLLHNIAKKHTVVAFQATLDTLE